jgi:hypothetical protein
VNDLGFDVGLFLAAIVALFVASFWLCDIYLKP